MEAGLGKKMRNWKARGTQTREVGRGDDRYVSNRIFLTLLRAFGLPQSVDRKACHTRLCGIVPGVVCQLNYIRRGDCWLNDYKINAFLPVVLQKKKSARDITSSLQTQL